MMGGSQCGTLCLSGVTCGGQIGRLITSGLYLRVCMTMFLHCAGGVCGAEMTCSDYRIWSDSEDGFRGLEGLCT